MAGRRYLVLDVFAAEPLEGNPLAVVLDSEGLDTAAMQRIAGEFNLSETVFVLPVDDSASRARIRIFTPHFEMPFAGHPTVGSAIALAGEGSGEAFVLEENIGPVRCTVRRDGETAYAEFVAPRISEALTFDHDAAAIATSLGLAESDIGFDGHAIGLWSAGVPYLCVPLAGLDAMRRVQFDVHQWRAFSPLKDNGAQASAYLYCRETMLDGSSFHMRMFACATPSYEDPATGSAAAAFVGAAVRHERPQDGTLGLWIEQGIEMGRPSRIRLDIDVSGGRATAARIGGNAVVTARGTLFA